VVRRECLGDSGCGSYDDHRPRRYDHDDRGTFHAGRHPDHCGSANGTHLSAGDLSAAHQPAAHQPSAHQPSHNGTATADHDPDDHGVRVLSH
jgi:hypothetical protein